MPCFRKNQLLFLAVAVFFLIAFCPGMVSAEESGMPVQDGINLYTLKLDQPTLERGYTASIFDSQFRVGIFPAVLNEQTDIQFKEFKNPSDFLPLPSPEKKVIVSNIFEFDIKNKAAFHNEKPLIIEIGYPENSNNYKKINYWDKGRGEWVELPSQNILERKMIRAPLHLPYARLAIFENPNIMEVGVASWYAYKSCNCAASPDWPKGTKLKVTDLEDNDYVVVTVNDYGPDRSIHPDRVIDLDIVAFKKIAPKYMGLIRVRVEKL